MDATSDQLMILFMSVIFTEVDLFPCGFLTLFAGYRKPFEVPTLVQACDQQHRKPLGAVRVQSLRLQLCLQSQNLRDLTVHSSPRSTQRGHSGLG